MTLPELTLNSPTPGSKVPITTLAVAIGTTPAALTVEIWTLLGANGGGGGSPFVAALPSGLAQPGQFRFQIDSEICLDITGAAGNNRTVVRGVEGSTVATHASGANVFHYLTAGALQNLLSKPGPAPGTFSATTSVAAQIGNGGGVPSKVALNTVSGSANVFDLSGWFDTTNRRFTPQQAGYYQIEVGAVIASPGSTNCSMSVQIYKNGSSVANSIATDPFSTIPLAASVSELIYLNGSTDYVELWAWAANSAGTQLATTGTGWMTGFLASGIGAPSPGQGLATVARAHRAGTQPLTTGYTKVQFDTITAPSYDPGSNFQSDGTSARARYVCPATGYYVVDAGVGFSGLQTTPVASIYRNGTAVTQTGVPGNAYELTVSDVVACSAGDVLELWVSGNGQTGTVAGGSGGCYLAVVQVGGTNLVGALSPTAQSANYTAGPGQLVLMTGANTVTLPTAPMSGTEVHVDALTATVTIARGGTDTITNPLSTLATSMTLGAGGTAKFQYFNGVWYLKVDGAMLTSQPAGNTVIGNVLLANDANWSYKMAGDGTMSWGLGGANAPDVTLARSGAAGSGVMTLTAPGGLTISSTPSAGAALALTGTYNAMSILVTNPATVHTSTVMYLNMTGIGNNASYDFFACHNTAGTAFAVHGDSSVTVTGALTAHDVTTHAPAGNNSAFWQQLLLTDTQPTFWIKSDGTLSWGPGGAAVTDTALARTAAGVLSLTGVLKAAGQAWTALTLQNSWTNVSGTAQYMKDANGRVYLRGRIAGGATSTQVCALLPAGSRPGSTELYPAGALSSGNVPIAASVYADATGAVYVYFASAIASIDLTGINFLAEN